MHTTAEIRKEYDRLDALCGVDTREIEIVISSRAVKRLGSFRYPAPGRNVKPRITISSAILEDEEQFWDTVRHEYAHAAVWLMYPGERHGHDGVWKAVCRRIGCAPKSLAPPSQSLEQTRRERAKYMVRCRDCGAETYYLRAGKYIKLMERGYRKRLRCARCGGSDLTLYVRE